MTAALVLVLTGCGGGAGASVVEVAEPPAVTTPLEDVREASITLPGGPDWSTSLDGFVWVKRDDGFVTRIDPQTNEPSGEVLVDTKSKAQFGQTLCQGIGAGGGALWSCSGSDIVRVDPERREVTDSISVGKVFGSGRLVYAGGRIWVLTGEGDRLVGIEASTASVGPTVTLPAVCDELGPGADTVWVVCAHDGKVLSVDPTRATIEATVELESPTVAVGTERDLWVGSAGRLVRIDLQELAPVARFARLDPGSDGDLAVEGDDVWVRSSSGVLHHIDAASNTVAERIEPREPLSSGSLVVDRGSIWMSASDDNVVFRLRPTT